MKTDKATKLLLLGILIALVLIGVQVTPTATALNQIHDVNIAIVGGRWFGDALPVSIEGGPLQVTVVQ